MTKVDLKTLLDFLAAISWPVVVLVLVFVFRTQLAEFVRLLLRRTEAGHGLKIWQIELPGISTSKLLDTSPPQGTLAHIETATDTDKAARKKLYEEQDYFQLVHQVRPDPVDEQNYDISVYLHPHKSAKLANIKRVKYYLGRHFGKGQHGSRFVVDDPRNGFALKVRAYGPTLCVAEVVLHSGNSLTLTRYLDIEIGPVLRKLSVSEQDPKDQD